MNGVFSVPDIGPVYGHQEAYTLGQVGGSVVGLIAASQVGNIAGGTSALVRCGSLAQQLAKGYTYLETLGGIGNAVNEYQQTGSVGVGGLLAFAPVLTMGLGKLRGVPTNCFEAGTMVLVADPAHPDDVSAAVGEPIEDVKVGDLVWTKDQSDPDGPLVLRPVTRTFVNVARDLQAVSVQGNDGNVEVLHVTDEHPFYVRGQGWTKAVELHEGFELVTADGARYTVVGNADDARPAGVAVYNLEVADGHTYFVADGSGADVFVWAHNSCVMANNRSSRRPNHGYVIFDENTGNVIKFGISSGKIRSDGLSFRALFQISKFNKNGLFPTVKLRTITLENFKNRARAIDWEEAVVDLFRKLGHGLPKQIRP